MRKSFYFTIAFIFMLTIITTGCEKSKDVVTHPPIDYTNDPANPFKPPQGDEFMPSSVSHEPTNAIFDDKGNRLPFQYVGGEFTLDYTLSASGKAKNVGFFIYVNGIPQPYKIDTPNAPNEYMHIFNLPNDDAPAPFSFIFTPIIGEKGDLHTLNIVSVYNPSFKPNMQETMSYGMYHHTLPMDFLLEFKVSTNQIDIDKTPNKNYLQNVSIYTKPITNKMLTSMGGLQDALTLENLNTDVFTQLLINSNKVMDNLKINKDESVHIAYELCGVQGVIYKTTFYINHKPISSSDASNFTTTLFKGNLSVIEADIDSLMLDDLNTFYAISVPVNIADFPNEVIIIQKSMSILLYK